MSNGTAYTSLYRTSDALARKNKVKATHVKHIKGKFEANGRCTSGYIAEEKKYVI